MARACGSHHIECMHREMECVYLVCGCGCGCVFLVPLPRLLTFSRPMIRSRFAAFSSIIWGEAEIIAGCLDTITTT